MTRKWVRARMKSECGDCNDSYEEENLEFCPDCNDMFCNGCFNFYRHLCKSCTEVKEAVEKLEREAREAERKARALERKRKRG